MGAEFSLPGSGGWFGGVSGWSCASGRRDGFGCGLLDVHRLAVVERVSGIENDPVVGLEALKNFKSDPVVAADGQRPEVDMMIGVDDDGAQSFGAEKQSVDRNLETIATYFGGQVNLRIAAREEFAGIVGHVDFGEQRAGIEFDGFSGANNFALKFTARELSEFEISDEPGMDGRRSALRNVYEDANGISLREEKKLLGGTTVAGVDERADVHVAAGDDSAERSINVFERLQFLQSMNIGLRRGDDGLLGGVVTLSVVDFLLGYAIGLDQFFVTSGGNTRKISVGLGGLEVGFGLNELLIYFGSVDVGE